MSKPRLILKMNLANAWFEPGDIRVLDLRHPMRPELPWAPAGAHVDVHLPTGRVRQYSLFNSPDDRGRYLIAVKRENPSRGGSSWLHSVEIGQTLPISVPRSHFALVEGAAYNLLLAGGIGITPILAMARSLSSGDKPFDMHLFTRGRSFTPFLAELKQEFGARLQLHFDDQVETRCDLAGLLKDRMEGAHLYYCGPSGFMKAIDAGARHWPEHTVHFEAFQPPREDEFEPKPFKIEVCSTGQQFDVPADRTALDVLRSAGFFLPASCENGVCGTCECGYLAGNPIHRDAVLSINQKATRFIPCVSRATGAIKLDM